MPADDPEAAHNKTGQQGQAADRVVTIVLLAAHAFLVTVTVGVLGMLVMATDPCGYRKCGDPAWIDRAMLLGVGGGAVVFVVTLIVAVRRLARQRTAFFVPLAGGAAQVALAIGAAAMETLAGPV
ncbi:hypothetical protein MSAS_52700 [Mycobacterium saskatchewanense]|uniref:Uncharacterized protein n=1 Tax=Mycobacterium saskatchewanense TaxID=220927 RepID=A0AAJ3TX01_9MYCO|nr:DUF6264 family protein [Mycobacterium saskatchewanense]ORW75110.1 hypothetical protein AWC23_03705 [Mycobacterium saskatchewanense]BBX66096.1 hypothetical protein MSAS_52700 [Mycobacterium saskatchewanense]